MSWIDVHAHLNMLETSPEETLQLCAQNGVERLFTIGTTPDDLPLVLSLAEKYYPQVNCTLGIHPHDAKLYTDEVGDFILKNASRKEVVAVGEIGLDFYYENSDRSTQLDVFEKQMHLAEKLQMPIEIHTRDAEPETVEILKTFKGRVKGLLHCFTGTQWLADQALDLGYNISISGVVTFKNAESLRNTVKTIPLDRLHVETDAPFLAPIPHRGKKNTPAYVVHTADVVAQLKGVSLEVLAEQTRKNALSLFPKLHWP